MYLSNRLIFNKLKFLIMENFILNNLYLFYDERNGIHGICFGKTLEEAKENARYYLSVKFDDISDQKGLEENELHCWKADNDEDFMEEFPYAIATNY